MSSHPLRLLAGIALVALCAASSSAEVVRIEVRRRDTVGGFERLIGRVFFTINPKALSSRDIADIDLAPTNAAGLVEFSSDLLLFRPRDVARGRGAVFLEVVNRGRDQSLGLMSAALQRDLAPEQWSLGDRFVLTQGFTLAFLGWQFDVQPPQGLTFQAPTAPVRGDVRASYVHRAVNARPTAFAVAYCAHDAQQPDAVLTVRSRIDGPAEVLPRSAWRFGPGGCSIQLPSGTRSGLYEAIYQASGSPIAGLGLAAVRDFASYVRYGGPATGLDDGRHPAARVIGFGYSQSGRFLREFVRDGFNADAEGRRVFDGLLIASAGAGGGSFNHRFATPGEAGNSVLSILRPVDIPPFVDEGLLARAASAGVVPRIFYTLSSTEYWARAASLTHTNGTGTSDVALTPSSRIYFLAGTPHSGGPLPPTRMPDYQHALNFAEQRWVLRALLIAMDDWIRAAIEPPPSRYPTTTSGELVTRDLVRFPRLPSLPFPTYMPQVWPMDYGPEFSTSRVMTRARPLLGTPFALRVPQVNADGNDLGGIALPEIAVPLGTYSGWNVSNPPLPDLGYLAGLVGSFEPFMRTRRDRQKAGDSRLSIEERYRGLGDYLDRVSRAAKALVLERFLLPRDVSAVVDRARAMWEVIVDIGADDVGSRN
ncbi:MAG: alpha/beta hydrolase domain-containing protein [Acidobacteriota bacterium]